MQLFVYCILFTMSENVEKVFLPGHIVLTHLTELFLNAVLYHRHIYPDGIFRKRRAYNTVSHVVIFPPLISYLKRILEVLLELIQTETLNAVELVFISKGEQVECHELKVNNYTEITKESDFETQDTMKDLLLKLNCKLSTLNPLPEDTTFEINVYTTFGSLQTINSKSQEFLWKKCGEGDTTNINKLLYNPVWSKGLGIDIAVNQKIDLILS